LFVTNMTKLLHHRSYPQQSLTDKQASLSTSYLASIPGLYSYMRAPPFQDTWNVTLGGSAQDLRGEKISARGCDLTDRSRPTVQLIRIMTRGHTSRKERRAREVCQLHWHRQKKAPTVSRLFGFGCGLLFVACPFGMWYWRASVVRVWIPDITARR
jgi:hypothetical protein